MSATCNNLHQACQKMSKQYAWWLTNSTHEQKQHKNDQRGVESCLGWKGPRDAWQGQKWLCGLLATSEGQLHHGTICPNGVRTESEHVRVMLCLWHFVTATTLAPLQPELDSTGYCQNLSMFLTLTITDHASHITGHPSHITYPSLLSGGISGFVEFEKPDEVSRPVVCKDKWQVLHWFVLVKIPGLR